MPDAKALRVWHICPRPSFSGLEAYAFALAEGQMKLGLDVRMAVLAGSPLAEKCRAANVERIEVAAGAGGRLGFIRDMIGALRSPAAPDIVHLHSTQDIDPMLAPLFLSRLPAARGPGRKRPQVIMQTHIWISHSKRDPLHAISYSVVDEVWCSSGPARETLKRFLPFPERKIRVVNYGRDIAAMEGKFFDRAQARQALGLPADGCLVVNVARIDEGKGTSELLEGTLRAMEKHPDLGLVLIGAPTPDDPKAIVYGRAINERIALLPQHLRARVHALGQVAESYRYLKAFDLFALPTYCECFSLSLLEALLAGLPCLSSDTGGSPEVVRPGETGWLFAPRSADAIEQTLEQAFSARALWPKMGAAGAVRVRKDYDFAQILPQVCKLYHRISLG